MTTAWLTETEADTYFTTRLGASTFWVSGADKVPALTTAQWQIENCGEFGRFIDVDVSGNEADAAMQNAVCEQALFLLRQGDTLESRADLLAQGVVAAGIVKETYKKPLRLAICYHARGLLLEGGYGKFGQGFRYALPSG